MTEGIGEATLSVNSPGSVMILDAIASGNRTGSDGPCNERIGIIDEDFNSNRRLADDSRTRKSLIGGFVKKVRRASNVQPYDGTEAPQLAGSERSDVPLGGGRCILNGEHERNGHRHGLHCKGGSKSASESREVIGPRRISDSNQVLLSSSRQCKVAERSRRVSDTWTFCSSIF